MKLKLDLKTKITGSIRKTLLHHRIKYKIKFTRSNSRSRTFYHKPSMGNKLLSIFCALFLRDDRVSIFNMLSNELVELPRITSVIKLNELR